MENFPDNVIKEIEARGIIPKPRWHFLITRKVFWLLAVASILVGSVAFAVADFVFFDNDGISLITLRDAPIQDIVQSIPFIWLFVLGLFIASAYFGFRHTRKGYRYATILVVSCVIGVSIVIGLILNALDFGQSLHQYLLKHTGFYDSLIHSRDDEMD